MDLRQEYRHAYDALEGMIRKRVKEGRFTALGYTSNLDLVCDFQIEEFNRLLEKYMPDARMADMKPVSRIYTVEDLLETVVYYSLRGLGGEVDLEDPEVVEKCFSCTYGMGGTAVQAAMALNTVGCPSLVHLTDDCEEVRKILDTFCIYTVSPEGKPVHTGENHSEREREPHFIIQFKKGDVLKLGEQEAEIPCSNRLIITKVTVNETVPFYQPYFMWVEENAGKVSSNVLSGFNALKSPELLKERLEYVKRHVEKYHENNPEGIVFFEDAHYHHVSVKKLCLETIYSSVDIVSLNEEELNDTLNNIYEFPLDINDIFSCVEGAKYIRERFGIRKGVIIHTKDYSMYVGEALRADIRRGLMYGNLLATAKAANGWYGDLEKVEGVLEFDLSPRGTAYFHKLAESRYREEAQLVPSCYLDRPKYTIGLGDSFVGGVQMCF